MPIFNGQATLKRALDSLLAQSYGQWELLAVDDASIDGTLEVLEEYCSKDRRVRVFRIHKNLGPSAARNVGLRHASGEFIAYLDCDDEFYPTYLEKIARFGSRGDVLIFAVDLVSDAADGSFVPGGRMDPAALREELFECCPMLPLGVAHRRDLIDRVGGFNEHLWQIEEWDLWKRFARSGAEFLYLPLTSGRYHIRSNSRSNAPRLTSAQRTSYEHNRQMERTIYTTDFSRISASSVRPLLCVSVTNLWGRQNQNQSIDLGRLAIFRKCGVDCRVYCRAELASGAATDGDGMWRNSGAVVSETVVSGCSLKIRLLSFHERGIPVTMFGGFNPSRECAATQEYLAFLSVFDRILIDCSPASVLIMGDIGLAGDIISTAKRRDAIVVLSLNDVTPKSLEVFHEVDYVVVPSEFARRFWWQMYGVDSVVLPVCLDLYTVVTSHQPRYVTFVDTGNPSERILIASIMKKLERLRPDIPLLAVDSSGQQLELVQGGPHTNATTAVPHIGGVPSLQQYLAITRVVIVPTLNDDAVGVVATQAMTNGLPVIASSRGAIPEVIGDAGIVLALPLASAPNDHWTPSPEEVAPWIDAIVQLWDHWDLYRQCSERAIQNGDRWRPARVIPRYLEFLNGLQPQPGPPFVPKDGITWVAH